jgi:hypothetical protein
MGINLGHWMSNAVRAAGRDVGSGAGLIEKETGKIAKDIDKVPFVGPAFTSLVDLTTTPFKFGLQVASGHNISQAALGDLKGAVKDVKEVAPYAQMVISFVPGIGPVVSGAIGAGLALAEGQPIDKALLAGAQGAMPGGPIGAAVFGAAVGGVQAAASHKPLAAGLLQTALDALPVPPGPAGDATRNAIGSAVKLAGSIAKGEKPGAALLTAADQNLASLKDIPGMAPGSAAAIKTALGAGIGMAHAQVIQSAVNKGVPGILDKLQGIGHAVVLKDPVVAAAAKTAPAQRGFEIGMGVMQHQIGVASIQSIRGQLKGADLKAFDIATSLHVGRVTTAPVAPSAATPPDAAASAAITAAGMPATTYPVALATGVGVATMAVLALLEAPVVVAWGMGAAVAGIVLFVKRR